MFLIIFEDGELALAKAISEWGLQSADEGILQLVDLNTSEGPKEYFQGEWTPIKGT